MRFISVPENRSALLAVRSLAQSLRSPERRAPNPLFLNGPPGCGKTCLVNLLLEEVRGHLSSALQVPADELEILLSERTANGLDSVLEADLLIVEDVHRLGIRVKSSQAMVFERLVQLLDHFRARQQHMVLTAKVGPGEIPQFPARLVSRLGAGLVVSIPAYQLASRLTFLREKAQRKQLAASDEVLLWIARHAGGSLRQLEGALAQVEALGRDLQQIPDERVVAEHLSRRSDVGPLTVDGITDRVSQYFGVKRKQVQSKDRYRKLLLPRQVSMYLARQLTDSSLADIGSFFGGRDHTTVLHACRKVTQAISSDPAVDGAVKQLRSELE
jgi:chromosomal replication initiator protein